MIYSCIRCGYETNHKGHFLNHLNRKKICKTPLSDISIEDIKNHYNLNLDNTSKITHYNSSLLNMPSKIPQKTLKNEEYKQCSYCCKEFSRVDNLNRHLKTCKKKKKVLLENEELRETVEKLLIECSNMKNLLESKENYKSKNIINSNNTNSNNTIHNTININNYGEEDTKYITKQFIVNLLANKPFKAIPEMIKHTHFNKDHPENQNIKLTNKKESYVKVLKDNKWEYQDRKNTITDLIDKQHLKITDEKIEKKIDKTCSNIQKNSIERCNDLYIKEDEDYKKRLYNESELVVINNS